jgi:hypothetical protein
MRGGGAVRRTPQNPNSLTGFVHFIVAMGAWSLLIILVPASLTYGFVSTLPQIDDTIAVIVAMGVGIGVGWVIGRATYRPLARWLDPTPRCKCGYDIRGLDSMLCPECGEAIGNAPPPPDRF